MLGEEQLDELYGEINRPYTEAEYRLHTQNRTLKSELEIEHAYNHENIMIADMWRDYIAGTGEMPTAYIWRIIRPGKNLTNTQCIRIKAIFEAFAEYEHGQCPRMPIVVYASRSAATLLERLYAMCPSGNLDDADFHLKELIALISNEQRIHYTHDVFAHEITTNVNALIDALEKYSKELGDHIRAIIRQREREAAPADETKKIVAAVKEDGKTTRKHLAHTRKVIVGEVRKAAQGADHGCHHPKASRDRYVQELITYLAKPGIVFSINNGCIRVAGKNKDGKCKMPWFYDWCHVHEQDIQTAVEIARSYQKASR